MVKSHIAIKKFLPLWTKRVATELGGRDPLGLSRTSNMITDYLLTGIITTTERARYYSFYCWALWHIQKEGSIHKFQDFVDGFRRREAMVALSTIASNYNSTTVGAVAVRSELSIAREEGEVKTDFRVLPSNALGGYGQYYSGCLYELGLTCRLEDGIDRIANGIAEDLANCFNKNVEKSMYIKNRLFKRLDISNKEFEDSKPYFTLDALNTTFAYSERQKLIELFFGFHEDSPSERTLLRRQTLAHILNAVLEYQNKGSEINLEATRKDFPTQRRYERLDWYIVYPMYYYDVLWPAQKKTITYNAPQYFKITNSLWKQFCLQEFVTQAIEGILTGILKVLASESVGISIDEVIRKLLNQDFQDFFKNILKNKCTKPFEIFSAIGIDRIPDEDISNKLQKTLSILHPLSEAQILAMDEKTPGAETAQGVLLLAILYGKWRGIKTNQGFLHVANNAGVELWIGRLFPYIDTWLNKQSSWEDILKIFINDMVLDQHDRVMFEKRNLESCWLHRVDGKIIRDQDYSPRWRSSRHNNAFSILTDLCLIELGQNNNASVTKEGKEILKKLLK